jgi:acetyl esterase/lipase
MSSSVSRFDRIFDVKTIFILIASIVITITTAAQDPARATTAQSPEGIPIWQGAAPNEKGDIGAEYNKTVAEHKLRITNVTTPTITIYYPSAEKDSGTSVLICPGGAYNVLALDIEGEAVRQWLNSLGVTAIVLKYRVPRREGRPMYAAPLEDAQRAMGLLRLHAKEWRINPDRLGVIGFSAGGHLAALLCNSPQRTYTPIDAADNENCRPDFAMLIYPFYMTPDDDHTKLSPEFHVTSAAPPSFIVMTEDDRVWYAFTYALALKEAKVPFEMHIYAKGGHGYGLGKPDLPVSTWPRRAEEWLTNGGWLKSTTAPQK